MQLHVGPELPGVHHRVQQTGLRHKIVIPPATFVRGRRAGKAGPVATRHIGGQRELADDEQATRHILQAVIHLAACIVEHAQLDDFGQQLVGLGMGIAALGAHQQHQAGPNLAHCQPGNVHAGTGHPLQQGFHGITPKSPGQTCACPPVKHRCPLPAARLCR